LQFTLAFVTFTGATLGTQTAATNAILMQFFALIALGLDGVANAVEALVGEQKGRRNLSMLKRQVNTGLFWSSIFSLVYAIVFWLFGSDIINLLTDQLSLRENAKSYLGLMIALPLIAHWCFLFDGVFVGLTHGRAMRDSMILSAAVGFFAVWWMVSTLIQGSDAYAGMENYGLWLALLSFLASRGLILGLWYGYLLRKPDERLWI
jgi:MATE family multidrug resistance protein